MTIRDLVHLLLTAKDLDKDVKIANGCQADITRVEFIEDGEFLISANGYNIDKVTIPKAVAQFAIACADALINELKLKEV